MQYSQSFREFAAHSTQALLALYSNWLSQLSGDAKAL
jgi:hypothetical protein